MNEEYNLLTQSFKDKKLVDNVIESVSRSLGFHGEFVYDHVGSGRPMSIYWREFTNTMVTKTENDWVIFGQTKCSNRCNVWKPFIVKLSESTNIFEVKIGSFYPYRTSLNKVNYEAIGNNLIVDFKDVPSSSGGSKLRGIIGAQVTKENSIEDEIAIL